MIKCVRLFLTDEPELLFVYSPLFGLFYSKIVFYQEFSE